MNILFLSIGRLNSIQDKGIYTDLLREFRDSGHNVFVVSPRERRLNKPTEQIIENGVNFLKVKIGNIKSTNIIEKGISTITIEHFYLKQIKKYYKNIKFDLIVYSTPPITFGKIINYIKKRDNAKTYLLLKDIFPQNAVDLEMFSKKSIFYKYFRFKEKELYELSDHIGCMSKANVDFILNNNQISSNKVEICPNSIEPILVNKDKKIIQNIREKYNIPLDRTIFIYGGNLGKPQGIDFLIECIKSSKFNENTFFVIVGSGTEFTKIKRFFEQENPKNAKLIEQLSKKDYEDLANTCDVGLIFLDHRFSIPNFPSRLLSYMQASMPVLAATDVNSDVGQVIEDGGFGYWCESNDLSDFNEKLNKLCNPEKLISMGMNSRKYLEDHYTSKHSYDIIMRHF